MDKIKIEIQYFHGCPNSKKMIENVKHAVRGIENRVDISEILIENNATAEEVKFRGSPTVLINGNDLLNEPEPLNPAMSCRYFPGGLPGEDFIKDAIQRQMVSI